MNCLYMLDINPLLQIFANIFSHILGCVFILSMDSFATQKILHLIRPYLFIFAFIYFASKDRSKKILLQFMSKSIPSMFSSRSFIVSNLTFRSLIHLGFTLYLFIYLGCVGSSFFCARAFSSCGKQGPLFIAVRRPLTIAASLVAEHRLQTRRLSSCGSRAQLLRGMRDLPRPGLEPVSPALAGRFSTTAPPGKPRVYFCIWC